MHLRNRILRPGIAYLGPKAIIYLANLTHVNDGHYSSDYIPVNIGYLSAYIKKYLKEISLTEQPFVKNPELTVGKLVKDAGAEIVEFVRFEVGEGIEKDEKDFATEVAEQLAAK